MYSMYSMYNAHDQDPNQATSGLQQEFLFLVARFNWSFKQRWQNVMLKKKKNLVRCLKYVDMQACARKHVAHHAGFLFFVGD